MIGGPVFDQPADGTRTQKRGSLNAYARALRNFSDGPDVVFVGSRGAIRPDLHARTGDLPGQSLGIGVGARSGAGQTDIHHFNAQSFHQMEDLYFFADGRVDYGGILQAITQRLVVERDFPARVELDGPSLIPVVDQLCIIHCRKPIAPRGIGTER